MSVDPRNPTGDYFKNRDYLIDQEHGMFERCQQTPGHYLNLGCSSRILDNFKNIDKYYVHPRVINDDISTLESVQSPVDLIFSAHSLEHVRHRLTRRTLKRWGELLVPGGELWLSMPDLDFICEELIKTKDSKARTWLRYTLFGYQSPGNMPDDSELDDPGQYHISGYAGWEMEIMLAEVGITTEWLYRYDGWATPSFFILGVKK